MCIQWLTYDILNCHTRIKGRIWILEYHLHFLTVRKHILMNLLAKLWLAILINDEFSLFIVLLTTIEQYLPIEGNFTCCWIV